MTDNGAATPAVSATLPAGSAVPVAKESHNLSAPATGRESTEEIKVMNNCSNYFYVHVLS